MSKSGYGLRGGIGILVSLIQVVGSLLLASAACSQKPKHSDSRLEQRGVKPSPPLKQLEKRGFRAYRKKFALVIGIDDYRNGIRELHYAVSDAQAVHTLLVDHLGFDVVSLLLNENARRTDVLEAIVALKKEMQDEDQFLFYFSGHGVSFGKGPQEIGFLLPWDTRGATEGDVHASAISMIDLRERIVRLPAKHVLLMIDACFGGYAAWTPKNITLGNEVFLRTVTTSRARQIITAGKRDQVVIESDAWGHSAFAYKLLEGLHKRLADADRNGIIIATELFSYLSPAVTKITKGRQTPQYGELLPDEGEFVFILPSGASLQPRPEPSPGGVVGTEHNIGRVPSRDHGGEPGGDVLFRQRVLEAESYCAVRGENTNAGIRLFRQIIGDLQPQVLGRLNPRLLELAEAEYREGSPESACDRYVALFHDLYRRENSRKPEGDRP